MGRVIGAPAIPSADRLKLAGASRGDHGRRASGGGSVAASKCSLVTRHRETLEVVSFPDRGVWPLSVGFPDRKALLTGRFSRPMSVGFPIPGFCFLAWLAEAADRALNFEPEASAVRLLAAVAMASASPMSPIRRHPLPTYL